MLKIFPQNAQKTSLSANNRRMSANYKTAEKNMTQQRSSDGQRTNEMFRARKKSLWIHLVNRVAEAMCKKLFLPESRKVTRCEYSRKIISRAPKVHTRKANDLNGPQLASALPINSQKFPAFVFIQLIMRVRIIEQRMNYSRENIHTIQHCSRKKRLKSSRSN